MAIVHCTRCGQDRDGLPNPPFGGELAAKIQQRICRPCWMEWIGMQTKIINEYRLNVVDPQAQEALLQQMQQFLGLIE